MNKYTLVSQKTLSELCVKHEATIEELTRESSELAAKVERLEKVPYTQTREDFNASWGLDGLPADKQKIVNAAWDRAEWLFNQKANELAAQVERLRGAASGAKDMLIECANQFRAIGNQDGHGNFADKHAMYVDRVLSETPTQSLEASKRLWKETLAVHCYEYSFLADDRAVEQSILVSEVLSFEP
jgi:hypothetical protein